MMEGHRAAKDVTDVLPALRRLYYDIASTTSAFALRSLQEFADPSHIFGPGSAVRLWRAITGRSR